MKFSDISIGDVLTFMGYTVEVTGFDGNLVIIECQELGEDGVEAKYLTDPCT